MKHPYSATIKHIYENSSAHVATSANQPTDKFNTNIREDDIFATKFFVAVLESIFLNINWGSEVNNINGKCINHFRFAGDIVLIADNLHEAQNMLNMLNDASEKLDLKINLSKSEYTTNLLLCNIFAIDNINIEQVHIYT